LGTWTVVFGGTYLATRKKEEKALKDGPKIQSATSDPEEAKFIEYGPPLFDYLFGGLEADWVGIS
jgi:hypothetical protein